VPLGREGWSAGAQRSDAARRYDARLLPFYPAGARVAQTTAKTARTPFANCAAAFNVDYNTATINFSAVAALVRVLHVGLALILDKGISSCLARHVMHNPQRFDRPILLEFAPQFMLRGVIWQPRNEESLVRITRDIPVHRFRRFVRVPRRERCFCHFTINRDLLFSLPRAPLQRIFERGPRVRLFGLKVINELRNSTVWRHFPFEFLCYEL
jgi:hypothetical protein